MKRNQALPAPGLDKIVLWCLICAAIITFAIYFYFSFSRYFQGDDFPYLIESSGSLKIIFSPQSEVHFRPIERIHLALTHIFGLQPVFFNLWSLLLHAFTAFSMYLAFKEVYNKKIACYSALLFFIIFSYNETLYWIAQAQVIYCLLFAFLAIYASSKNKTLLALLFVFLSSFSYSLWYVLPVYFFFSGKKKKMFFLSLLVVGLHILLMAFFSLPLQYYGPVKQVTEIPARVMYCLFKTLLPFSKLEVGIPIFILFILAVAVSLYLFIKKRAAAVPFLVFYFVPAVIFLLSSHIPSRFFYFPAAAVALVLVLSFLSVKKPYNYIGGILILYLAILSPVLNYLDGVDYKNYSLEYKKIIKQGDELRSLKIGDRAILINKMPQSVPQKYIKENLLAGRLKLLFNREKALAGLLYPKDYVDFILLERNLKSIPLAASAETCRRAKQIEMGDREIVSTYCFEAAKK